MAEETHSSSVESIEGFNTREFALEVVAYAGYSCLCLASTTPFIYATYKEDAFKQDKVIICTFVSNILAGTLLLVNGIMTVDKPLRSTMACLIGMSFLGLIGKFALFIKKNRQERLY